MKTIYGIFLLSFITACSSHTYWVKTKSLITEGLHDIEMVNDKLGLSYSYGTGNLYKTMDAGKNWNKIYQFDSLYFEQIQFVDEKTGWMVGSPNKVFKTQDGGTTWVNQSIESEAKSLIYGMYFENAKTGYIAPFDRKGTRIYKTDDGGNTWQKINTIDKAIFTINKIENTLYGTGYDAIVKDIQQSDNWAYVYKDTTKKVGQIRDIVQNESGKIIATSFNGYIVELEQEDWTSTQITKNRLRNLIAYDKNTWITVGDTNKEAGNLFTSKDNGKTWEKTQKAWSDIHRITTSNSKIWMVGKEGLICSMKK